MIPIQFMIDGQLLDGVALEVSDVGLHIQSDISPQIGTVIVVYFGSQADGTMASMESKVTWTRGMAGQTGVSQTGVRFIRPSPKAIEVLRRVARQGALLAGDGSDSALASNGPTPGTGADSRGPSDAVAAQPEELDLPRIELDELGLVATLDPADRDRGAGDLEVVLALDSARRKDEKRRAQGLLKRGREALGDGRADEATQLLGQAMRCLPESVEIAEALAEALFRGGDVAEAAKMFERALRMRQERG